MSDTSRPIRPSKAATDAVLKDRDRAVGEATGAGESCARLKTT